MNNFSDSKILPKKRYGQNFLTDKNIINNIVELSGDIENRDVLEIGGGTGNLTQRLLKENPRKLVVLEIDKDLIPTLQKIGHSKHKNIEIICEDILKFNILDHFKQPPIIVGNLPYNTSTKILANLLKPWPLTWDRLVLMFQIEVARRIVSQPNCKTYGRLSLLSQFRSKPTIKMKISNKVFFPIPKIKSAIVVFEKKEPSEKDVNFELFLFIIKQSFSQRRKKLVNCLKEFFPNISNVLYDCGIKIDSRAENLSINDYQIITRKLNEDKV